MLNCAYSSVHHICAPLDFQQVKRWDQKNFDTIFWLYGGRETHSWINSVRGQWGLWGRVPLRPFLFFIWKPDAAYKGPINHRPEAGLRGDISLTCVI